MLHPTLQEMITITKEANNPPLSRMSLAEIRRGPAKIKPLAGEPKAVAKTLNHMIHLKEHDLLIRLYYPKENTPLPLLLYFHPGGFVKGDIDAHDPTCRDLSLETDCIVAAINYPLAPENPFPQALNQVKELFLWTIAYAKEIHCDGRIGVVGENAGGNLAAVLTQEMKADIAFQVLIYPQTDLTFSLPSHQEYGSGYLLEQDSLKWYKKQYLPSNQDPADPKVSPLFATDFSNLPPTLIITAEYDPLRDEGEAYGQKLKNGGVPITLKRYEGMVHGFLQMTGILEEARLAMQEIGETLKTHFSL